MRIAYAIRIPTHRGRLDERCKKAATALRAFFFAQKFLTQCVKSVNRRNGPNHQDDDWRKRWWRIFQKMNLSVMKTISERSVELWTEARGACAVPRHDRPHTPTVGVGVPPGCRCSRCRLADKDRSETETATGNDRISKDRKENILNYRTSASWTLGLGEKIFGIAPSCSNHRNWPHRHQIEALIKLVPN